MLFDAQHASCWTPVPRPTPSRSSALRESPFAQLLLTRIAGAEAPLTPPAAATAPPNAAAGGATADCAQQTRRPHRQHRQHTARPATVTAAAPLAAMSRTMTAGGSGLVNRSTARTAREGSSRPADTEAEWWRSRAELAERRLAAERERAARVELTERRRLEVHLMGVDRALGAAALQSVAAGAPSPSPLLHPPLDGGPSALTWPLHEPTGGTPITVLQRELAEEISQLRELQRQLLERDAQREREAAENRRLHEREAEKLRRELASVKKRLAEPSDAGGEAGRQKAQR